jgi:putative ABC transport system permease protein
VYTSDVPFEDLGCIVANSVIQDRLRMERTYSVAFIYLEDSSRITETQRQIEAVYPSMTLLRSEDFSAAMQNQMQYIDVLAWIISLLSVIVGGVGVLNTMMMSVSERVREIGTLRAVGGSCRRILTLIVSEGLVLATLGGAAGLLLGYVGTELILKSIPQFGFTSHYTPQLFLQALAIAIGLGFVGSLYPAWQASRLSPVEALKYE